MVRIKKLIIQLLVLEPFEQEQYFLVLYLEEAFLQASLFQQKQQQKVRRLFLLRLLSQGLEEELLVEELVQRPPVALSLSFFLELLVFVMP